MEKKKRGRKSDILEIMTYWIPEIILLPFRLVGWTLRGVGRLIRIIWEGF
ncbi:hypothetical protein [Paraliobacillus sp. X-1268]|nr:hypothetical protein [Paraliobacillus sp. X-1268]